MLYRFSCRLTCYFTRPCEWPPWLQLWWWGVGLLCLLLYLLSNDVLHHNGSAGWCCQGTLGCVCGATVMIRSLFKGCPGHLETNAVPL